MDNLKIMVVFVGDYLTLEERIADDVNGLRILKTFEKHRPKCGPPCRNHEQRKCVRFLVWTAALNRIS